MKRGIRKFPSDENIKRMEMILSKSNGSYILPPDAGVVEKAKYEICRQILIYMHKKGLTQRALSLQMGVPEARVNEIVHYKIGKFTLDKLLSYYGKINPKVSLCVD